MGTSLVSCFFDSWCIYRIYCSLVSKTCFFTAKTDLIFSYADGPRDTLCLSKYQLLHNYGNKVYKKSRTDRSNGVEGLQLTVV